jgi:hypothetical protein
MRSSLNRRVHFMRSSLNRRVHFMRSSLNRRVHFMRSSLTRLLQATSVVLWLDGDGAYLPPVPAAARPQPASVSHQRFRPLRAHPILLVMLFRSLWAPPVSPPCISRPNAAAVEPARPWPVPISGRALQATSGAADQPPCHHPALADLMQLLWYQCYRTPMRLGVRACLGFGWTHHAGGPTVRVA